MTWITYFAPTVVVISSIFLRELLKDDLNISTMYAVSGHWGLAMQYALKAKISTFELIESSSRNPEKDATDEDHDRT